MLFTPGKVLLTIGNGRFVAKYRSSLEYAGHRRQDICDCFIFFSLNVDFSSWPLQVLRNDLISFGWDGVIFLYSILSGNYLNQRHALRADFYCPSYWDKMAKKKKNTDPADIIIKHIFLLNLLSIHNLEKSIIYL